MTKNEKNNLNKKGKEENLKNKQRLTKSHHNLLVGLVGVLCISKLRKIVTQITYWLIEAQMMVPLNGEEKSMLPS